MTALKLWTGVGLSSYISTLRRMLLLTTTSARSRRRKRRPRPQPQCSLLPRPRRLRSRSPDWPRGNTRHSPPAACIQFKGSTNRIASPSTWWSLSSLWDVGSDGVDSGREEWDRMRRNFVMNANEYEKGIKWMKRVRNADPIDLFFVIEDSCVEIGFALERWSNTTKKVLELRC